MLVHRRVTPSSKFAGTHLYTWVERGTMGVKCLSQEPNTVPRPGLEPGLFDTESSALTIRPPRLPLYDHLDIMTTFFSAPVISLFHNLVNQITRYFDQFSWPDSGRHDNGVQLNMLLLLHQRNFLSFTHCTKTPNIEFRANR